MEGSCKRFSGYGRAITHELSAAVTAYTRPALEQASQNFSVDWGEPQELFSLPEELPGNDGRWRRERVFVRSAAPSALPRLQWIALYPHA